MSRAKVILDASCGSRMFWFDKHNPNVTYMDKRNETVTAPDSNLGHDRVDGSIFFIECKNETGRPRADQIRFHNFLMKQHTIHGIARSPEDALKIINGGLVGYGFK